jgi:low temperature requirement protein LtrA
VVAEISVPLLAERQGATPWHPHHISERYGLLTLIVLGESVLSATVAIQAALDAGHFTSELASVIAGALLVFFSMWWLYFDSPVPHLLVDNKVAFRWGYGHLVLFAAVAAAGAGLALSVDVATGHSHVSPSVAGMAVAVPVGAFLFVTWAAIVAPSHRGALATPAFLGAAVLVFGAAFTEWPVLLIGVTLGVLVALSVAWFPAHSGHGAHGAEEE